MAHPMPSARTPRRAAVKRSARAAESSATTPRSSISSLAALRAEAEHCRACPLWKNATQTVFGAGRASARIVFVGEQPGDREDLTGKPFVGPAGLLLDRALQQAGVDRDATYVTNAVKHFKFEPRGKRRLHKTPSQLEVSVCQSHWLNNELRLIEPALVVALGATAARAVFGRATAIGKNRGHVIAGATLAAQIAADVLVTVHPSYLLRVPDEDRDTAFEQFVADLKLARKYAAV
jgi:uracil-DNA glycosylase family protein